MMMTTKMMIATMIPTTMGIRVAVAFSASLGSCNQKGETRKKMIHGTNIIIIKDIYFTTDLFTYTYVYSRLRNESTVGFPKHLFFI